MDKPLWRMTRPTITFPAVGRRRPSTGTNLYCLVTMQDPGGIPEGVETLIEQA